MNFHTFKRLASLVLAVILVLGLSGWGPSRLQEITTAIDGDWTGTTGRGWPMSFTVSSSGSQWSNFVLKTDAVVGPCSVTMETTVPGPGSIINGQFSRSGTFSFTGQFITPTTATGTYSYTNQSVYGCGSFTQSGTWTASIQLPSPGDFTKSSPANGAISQPLSLMLHWNPSTNASEYQYCYDTSNDDDCSTSWISTGTDTSVNLTGLSSNTTYYWQVIASNATGSTDADDGIWWSFTTLPVITAQHFSEGMQDGWILESVETSGLGGTMNKSAATLRIGDDATNKQYRSILSFDTSSLPDDVVIASVTLKFKFAGKTGTFPFGTHGNLLVDVLKGFFKGNPALQLSDFNAKGTSVIYKAKALTYTNSTVESWYSQSLLPVDLQFINLTGVTQFRLRFSKDDNNDFGADFLKIYSGNALLETDRPQLVIEYYVP